MSEAVSGTHGTGSETSIFRRLHIIALTRKVDVTIRFDWQLEILYTNLGKDS